MIGRLRGKVVADEPGAALVLDVLGVGYDVLTPLGTAGRAETDADGAIVLHVHTHVREDALELFGFATEVERRVFRLLIEVPNVGPKTALGVMGVLPIEELAHAVESGDVARLTRVPGIGKKTAERFVLELKEKLGKLALGRPSEAGQPSAHDDGRRLLTALTNMGYRAGEAERALKSLGDRVGKEPIQTLLREALARLAP
jgi:Holliday junction DNA helicase RuvA